MQGEGDPWFQISAKKPPSPGFPRSPPLLRKSSPGAGPLVTKAAWPPADVTCEDKKGSSVSEPNH